MVNIKYYVFLMTGIFLALGLGMMIGITLEDKDVIENQQMLLVRQIEERILHYRTETEKLSKDLNNIKAEHNQLIQIADMLLEETTANRLAGLNIAIVSFNDKADTENIINLLTHAGASIRSNIAFSVGAVPGMLHTDAKSTTVDYDNDFVHTIMNDLVYSLNFGGITPLIEEMQELGLIQNSLGYEVPVDSIIVLSKGKATSYYDAIFISYILDSGLPVVAVELSNSENSAIGDYKAMGVSTIDHIDTLYGKLSLISVLTGNKGSYGYSNHAEALIPDPLFNSIDPDFVSQNEMASINGGSQK